jgi:hypothetical protein
VHVLVISERCTGNQAHKENRSQQGSQDDLEFHLHLFTRFPLVFQRAITGPEFLFWPSHHGQANPEICLLTLFS